jgi:hypothetical protein
VDGITIRIQSPKYKVIQTSVTPQKLKNKELGVSNHVLLGEQDVVDLLMVPVAITWIHRT